MIILPKQLDPEILVLLDHVDDNVKIVGMGAVVRTLTKEDRERLNKIAKEFAEKYVNKGPHNG